MLLNFADKVNSEIEDSKCCRHQLNPLSVLTLALKRIIEKSECESERRVHKKESGLLLAQ